MAGSYQHLIGKDGEFRFEGIENMGDAYEACEDCFARIRAMDAAILEVDDVIVAHAGDPSWLAIPAWLTTPLNKLNEARPRP